MQEKSVDESAVGGSDDAETRSCPGDVGSNQATQKARGKWSHMRQASQGVPPRHMERAPRRKEIRLAHTEMIEREMTVLTEESLCGIGKWRPKWLQFLGHRIWMLFLLCCYCSMQGMLVNGLVPSAISSIERRFQFSTSHMGRIVQFYDFGYVLFCIPVSYFGGRHSKPAVLACGLACMALGSLIFSMPHMLSDSYSTSQSNVSHGTCSIANFFVNDTVPEALASTSCLAEKQLQLSSNSMYFYIFCLAHFLHGIGATPLFTIGVSYIDENVGPAMSSLYVGIFYSFAVFGPAVGFVSAGSLLKYHTDFWHLPPEQILKVSTGEMDPTWVGAWWLSFKIASFVGFMVVLPLSCLPKVLPASLTWHRARLHDAALSNRRRTPECCGIPGTNKTAALNSDAPTPEQAYLLYSSIPARGRGPLWYKIWLDVRHIPIAIYRILSNGPFMFITVAMAVDSLVVTGASSFMSKYLERQFSVAPSKSNILIGCVMVPMAGLGCMLTGYTVNYFRLNSVKMLKFAITLLFMSLMFTPMYMIYCPHDPMIGVDTDYPPFSDVNEYANLTERKEPQLISSCNSHCSCDQSEYRPVCAQLKDGRQFTYYSPCFAACAEPYSPETKKYTQCGCVPFNTKEEPQIVNMGACETTCTGLLGFLLLFAPLSFCTFAVAVPVISVILRTVDYNERSFALGIQWILIRIIGTIPAPVLFGWMFDVSCIKYQSDSCGSSSTTCLMHSNELLANLFMTFSIIGQAISMAILTCVLMFYGPALQDDADDRQPGDHALEVSLVERKELVFQEKPALDV